MVKATLTKVTPFRDNKGQTNSGNAGWRFATYAWPCGHERVETLSPNAPVDKVRDMACRQCSSNSAN